MSELGYGHLRVLVADDYSNFRATVNGMLGKLGVQQVDLASNGAGVVEACQKKQFDVILCDYDLGPGRNGQQVLEQLRHSNLISRRSIFIVVSADAAKDVVMAAYDCEPDDYLMKPVNGQILQRRMNRLLQQRQALAPVFQALEQDDTPRATALLTDLSLTQGRCATLAQKLLGKMFIEAEQFTKAEKLYTNALQTHQSDWARLGLATVKERLGEPELSASWLEQIISDNPLYLPAYDALADNLEARGKLAQVREVVQRSVDISPKSILRHKRLAQVAERTGDLALALKALRTVVRLGEQSCHACVDDSLNFARLAALQIEKRPESQASLAAEATAAVESARQRFASSPEQRVKMDLMQARVLALGNAAGQAAPLLAAAEKAASACKGLSVETHIERVLAVRAIGREEDAQALLQTLVQTYAYEQGALQKLDSLLAEPISEHNRALIASVNREGIALHSQGQFDSALARFTTVTDMFPRHIGVLLNIVQSLVGKLNAGAKDDETVQQTEHTLATIADLIEPEHSQFARYQRLQGMAIASLGKDQG